MEPWVPALKCWATIGRFLRDERQRPEVRSQRSATATVAGGARLTWLGLIACLLVSLGLIGCSPSSRPGTAGGEYGEPAWSLEQVQALAGEMVERIRTTAERIASFGPRQTGQIGCQKTFEYVKAVFEELDGGRGTVKEFGSTVTVPLDRGRAGEQQKSEARSQGSATDHTTLTVHGLGETDEVWDAHSFYPNNVQDCRTRRADETPRRLVDVGLGDWKDFGGKSVADAVVLLDYNSSEAWLLAKELGAYAAVFVEPSWTNWRQTDLKYLDMVPLDMPRVWVDREKGRRLREALADGKDVRVTVRSRLTWHNVHAPCVEFTVPGQDPDRTYILASQIDARSIVPDLAYGGDEVWGLAALIEIARFYSRPENRPAVNLRFVAVSGHWQAQRCTRDYLAYGGIGYSEVGQPVQMAMGLDFSTEGSSLNLIRETAWDDNSQTNYRWIKAPLFGEGGWHDQLYKGLNLRRRGVDLFADERPYMITTTDGPMAPRNWLSPLTYAPKFTTANEAWAAVDTPTFAFQTARLWRLTHNSPLDRFEASSVPARLKNLQPQLELTLAMLDRLTHVPAKKLPPTHATLKRRASWGGYVQARGRIQTWDPSTGWFSTSLPRGEMADAEIERQGDAGSGVGGRESGVGGQRSGSPEPEPVARALRTFIYALSTDAGFYLGGNGRERGYLGWPLAPSRKQHRELQSFMFRELRMLDEPSFRINTLYAAVPSAQVDVLGYALDEQGRIVYATDYGVHGDGNPAFQCTDVKTNYWDLFVPVTLFPCGSMELYGLVDVERWAFNQVVYGQNYIIYGPPGNHEDRGIQPYLRVMEVKNAESHTDMRSWGYVQYGPTAMVFLPANTSDIRTGGHLRAEVLLGSRLQKFTPLLNTDAEGRPKGYSVAHGETIRVNRPDQLAAGAYADQLFRFDARRLAEFAAQDVASPLAAQYHKETEQLLSRAAAEEAKQDWFRAAGAYAWAWTNEVKSYQHAIRLLLDVVSTTVFYFTLLIPFAFLVERLMFPQTNAVKTGLVAALVFGTFVALLYAFHPGFRLASNIVVTIVAFLIVVMTIPALILLLVRGVGMLKAMGSKAILLQRSEAETAGVVSASLSLSVSNMRRRKLRTGLTLSTITTLVVALVLLTTSTAFEYSLTEPQELTATTFHGIQLYNATDRRNALLPETVEALEKQLAGEALVLRREYVNYGYDHEAETCALEVTANGQRADVPYIQIFAPEDAQVEYRLPAAGQPGVYRTVHLDELIQGKDGHGVWFGPDDVNACMLPNTMAEQLGVRAGDTVEFMGQTLTVLGIWEARTVQRDAQGRVVLDAQGQPISAVGPLDALRDLDAQPITPLKFAVVNQGEANQPLHVTSADMIVLPRRWQQVQRILPAQSWSLIVIPKDPGRIPSLAAELSKQVMNVDVFYHFNDGGRERIEMIALRESTKVKGSGMMFFMLLIAVLMILAIMMGTVHERMREIGIFSSVGLAPRHVAGMFLIESLVYAGLASVLGYFIGIAALSFMTRAHLLPEGFYPNYLGVYVLYAIGVAMAATVASSIYPIRVATRLVNPSLERSWKIDSEPEGDMWRISLPFIATSTGEVSGMMTYAYEFLAVHQGERSGQFVCQTPPEPTSEAGVLGVQMNVWLAPFERNITQFVILRAEPVNHSSRWEFVLYLQRVSGPEYLWQRSNRAFVDALRKHLLNWRAMSSGQIEQFVEQAGSLFGAAV